MAAAGVPVAKHGNRAMTSACGSADVLEALGIATDLSPEEAAGALRTDGFAFLLMTVVKQRNYPAEDTTAELLKQLNNQTG